MNYVLVANDANFEYLEKSVILQIDNYCLGADHSIADFPIISSYARSSFSR